MNITSGYLKCCMCTVNKIHNMCVGQLLCKSLISQEDYKKNLAPKRSCSLAGCKEMRIIARNNGMRGRKQSKEKTPRSEKDNKSLGNTQYLGEYLWNNISHEDVYYLFTTVKLGKEKALFNFQIKSINKHTNPRGVA